MTLLNIYMKDKEKKKLQKYVENKTDKSMSEFVREVIAERIKIEELLSTMKKVDIPEILDFIPKN